jgi:ATP-dependent Clp protease adapter protein ClpS
MTVQVIDKPIDTINNRIGFGWKVVLYNCNCHTFNDVAFALTLATRCSLETGYNIAQKIHSEGRAIVYDGHKERAEAVCEVLKDGGLKASMEQ